MKPFITPETSATGKSLLPFQSEGIVIATLWNSVCGRTVVAYSLPKGHSFQAAWLFQLVLDDGNVLEFSSACTQVVDWQEVGSLNIRFIKASDRGLSEATPDMVLSATPEFRILTLSRLLYEDDDVISECALAFGGRDGEQIVIAAGIPPGSVSIAAPFSEEQFEPQFAMSTCRRESMQ
ncbi:MAG: hypothetical protein KKC79_05035 [Gammaproteobacteria bacterium]|nr:hypothetical protein [Gammaproteobacteria bacterium]MBU1440886.1 hypothetical protein [Gammaproteobacteria bacterium]MBU2407999.1 hypothetical protein [Gammaproteobacteria bacterium]